MPIAFLGLRTKKNTGQVSNISQKCKVLWPQTPLEKCLDGSSKNNWSCYHKQKNVPTSWQKYPLTLLNPCLELWSRAWHPSRPAGTPQSSYSPPPPTWYLAHIHNIWTWYDMCWWNIDMIRMTWTNLNIFIVCRNVGFYAGVKYD